MKDNFTLPGVCVYWGGGGWVFEETGSRDRREKFNWFKDWAERGVQSSNHKKKEKERTYLQAKKLTRGHVLIINDPYVSEMPPQILTVIIGLNWGNKGVTMIN